MASAIAIVLYLAVAFKIGFFIFDKTEHTGFYMITMAALMAMPIAILAQFLSK